ncbi:hypothetical protein PTRG_05012 [Pyrenophora tritici-repentis Pt-1C-BFP]|uniref:Uncharacterized protein n=1 Tax=Pyrenophora tritici-repentis (strain Pt-1C-BFP) TaxID=426418 RepID=B2W3G2_PYRTR|nr:uncharacterized protein PTRG_05012 [Pyrenophora tritici-repentis Pt-1C-BFP]EDU47919.1 hypothetical protein PTRG_05012 [Pyrenophora tritici-repentis Pt-1C-BFP]
MRFEIPTIVALLSSFASAVSVCRPHSKLNPFNDSRGCTIFKDQTCGSDPGFAIPGDSGYCADLNNLFADYDGKVRSFRVEKGYQCEFYFEYAYSRAKLDGKECTARQLVACSPAGSG